MPQLRMGQLKWLLVSLLVIGLDQLSKYIALGALQPYQPVVLFPGFNWTLAFNRGAAFSFLDDMGGWQQRMFALIAVVISAALVGWIMTMAATRRWLPAACAMVIGGALGNLMDRLLHGQVTDFIDWYVGQHHWPTFNLADSFILIGAVIIALDGFFDGPKGNPASGAVDGGQQSGENIRRGSGT